MKSEEFNPGISDFMNGINALMFGVESSRINTSFATGLMALEAVAEGTKTFAQIFDKSNLQGYPLASWAVPGIFAQRTNLLKPSNQQAQTVIESQPPTGINYIIIKEINMIISWLTKQRIMWSDLTKGDAEKEIQKLFTGQLNRYYG